MSFTLNTHRSCTGAHNSCWLSDGGEDWNNENGDWDNNRVDCCTTSFGNGMALGTQNPDMEFVKNFTQPDFQAKNFTPQKHINFSCKSTA